MILVIPFQKHSNTSYPRDNLTKLMFNSILDYPYTFSEESRIYIISFFYTCPIHASAIIPLCNAQLKMIFIFPFILFFMNTFYHKSCRLSNSFRDEMHFFRDEMHLFFIQISQFTYVLYEEL